MSWKSLLPVINLTSPNKILCFQVTIPNASNACSGFGESFAWTFFDLNQIYDEHKDDPVTVLQANFVSNRFLSFNQLKEAFVPYSRQMWDLTFACSENIHLQYHANELLPLKDEDVLTKVTPYLSKCIKDFDSATLTDKEIRRSSKSLTHFFPGSLIILMRLPREVTLDRYAPTHILCHSFTKVHTSTWCVALHLFRTFSWLAIGL